MIKLPSRKESNASIIDEIIKGFNNLLNVIPLLRIAIISLLFAIFDVKNITDIKINSGLNKFPK